MLRAQPVQLALQLGNPSPLRSITALKALPAEMVIAKQWSKCFFCRRTVVFVRKRLALCEPDKRPSNIISYGPGPCALNTATAFHLVTECSDVTVLVENVCRPQGIRTSPAGHGQGWILILTEIFVSYLGCIVLYQVLRVS